MLPPGEFLPVFEHYRMMPQLDRWVTRQVISRLAKGAKPPRLTINVSAQTIEDVEFPRFLAAEVKGDGSITRKLVTNEVARAKLGAVLHVGAAVGFGVIAECVEEPEVLERLRAFGVGYAQGFGIHVPQALDSLKLA